MNETDKNQFTLSNPCGLEQVISDSSPILFIEFMSSAMRFNTL